MIDNDLKKLILSMLEKYLNYQDLPKTGKNTEKVKLTICHVFRNVKIFVAPVRQLQAAMSNTDDSSSDDSGNEVI